MSASLKTSPRRRLPKWLVILGATAGLIAYLLFFTLPLAFLQILIPEHNQWGERVD